MKTLIRNSYLWIVCLGLSLIGLASCSDKTDDVNFENNVTSFVVTHPTIDSIRTTSSLKTYVVPGVSSSYATALTSRMTNTTSTLDESVNTIIMSDNLGAISNDDYMKIIKALVAGKNIVYCNPTKTNFSALCTVLGFTIDQMRQNGEFPDSVSNGVQATLDRLGSFIDGSSGVPSVYTDNTPSTGEFCQSLGIRGNEFHMSMNPLYRSVSDTVAASTTALGTNIQTSASTMTDYDYGILAEGDVSWIDAKPSEKSPLFSAENRHIKSDGSSTVYDMANDATCQPENFDSQVACWDGNLLVYVKFKIYSAYSPREDADYYLIQQEVRSLNSKLNCGYNYGPGYGNAHSDTDWKEWLLPNGDKIFYYGPYLGYLKIDNKFNGGADEVVSVSPINEGGSSQMSSGSSWSLGAGLSFGQDISASLSGSFTWSTSTTTTFTDLKTTQSYTGSNNSDVCWEYKAQNAPVGEYRTIFGLPIAHSVAPSILQTDATIKHSWVWKKIHPSGNAPYKFTTNLIMQGDMLQLDKTTISHYCQTAGSAKFEVTLNPPPRSLQEWTMGTTQADNKALITFLEKNFPKIWQPGGFTIACSTKENRDRIDDYITNFMGKLKNAITSWRDAKLTGTYQFYWRLQDSPDIYKTETITINP